MSLMDFLNQDSLNNLQSRSFSVEEELKNFKTKFLDTEKRNEEIFEKISITLENINDSQRHVTAILTELIELMKKEQK